MTTWTTLSLSQLNGVYGGAAKKQEPSLVELRDVMWEPCRKERSDSDGNSYRGSCAALDKLQEAIEMQNAIDRATYVLNTSK